MLLSQYHLVRIANNNFISISYRKFLFNLITSFKFKVVRNKKSKFFSHRYLIEFNETNRISHFPHLYDMVILLKYRLNYSIFPIFPEKPLHKRVWWRRFLAKNAQTTLCLKGCNICSQEDRRVKVGSMSP